MAAFFRKFIGQIFMKSRLEIIVLKISKSDGNS